MFGDDEAVVRTLGLERDVSRTDAVLIVNDEAIILHLGFLHCTDVQGVMMNRCTPHGTPGAATPGFQLVDQQGRRIYVRLKRPCVINID